MRKDARVSSEVIIGTSRGKVCGIVEEGVARFLGIPYAAAPVGLNRFRAPIAPAAWDGVLPARAYGPTPPKPVYPPPLNELLRDPIVPGEGWLNLNVWTPDPGALGLPVMVWIHGGAFLYGSSAVTKYNGATFARDGVVCVTINYRLGVEGFADLPGAPANRGLLDQIAALEWVQENIARFGGDPGKVTIFGQSAGGISVTTLLSLRRGRDLFHRAIAQSGAGHTAQSAADAAILVNELARRLEIAPTVEGLTAKSPEEIIAVETEIASEINTTLDADRWGQTTIAAGGLPFFPVIDGELLTQRPIDEIANGTGENVPVLTGTTTEEYRLFMIPTPLALMTQPMAKNMLAAYNIPIEFYDIYKKHRPGAGNPAAAIVCAVLTDRFFRIPAYRLAEARANAPTGTHVYEFAWCTPTTYNELKLGACHGLEIPFMWDTLYSDGDTKLTGPNPSQELATETHQIWLEFAQSANPGWPRYDPTTRSVMTFDFDQKADKLTTALVHDPRSEERQLWTDVLGP
jgi:para-nitrobenzyl esterase